MNILVFKAKNEYFFTTIYYQSVTDGKVHNTRHFYHRWPVEAQTRMAFDASCISCIILGPCVETATLFYLQLLVNDRSHTGSRFRACHDSGPYFFSCNCITACAPPPGFVIYDIIAALLRVLHLKLHNLC
jgi:hypothetical protein